MVQIFHLANRTHKHLDHWMPSARRMVDTPVEGPLVPGCQHIGTVVAGSMSYHSKGYQSPQIMVEDATGQSADIVPAPLIDETRLD
jgi:hypothetical protein